jgi:hypothetical protein
MSLDVKIATIDELVAAYATAAGVHGNAVVVGDYKKANPAADQIAAIYRELRDRGRNAQLSVLPLLKDPDAGVRAWAAAHALEFSPTDGERVLEELARDSGMLGFSAQMALREWRQGTLRFP